MSRVRVGGDELAAPEAFSSSGSPVARASGVCITAYARSVKNLDV